MVEGSNRVDVPHLWPATLIQPARPPKLVYLDLNHWIALAKAHTGHKGGDADAEVLTACVAALDSGSALFPISDVIYEEITKITNYRQRVDLREVIEAVSKFFVVTSRVVIATHEIEALLDVLVGPNPNPINRMAYLDWGAARALGLVGGFRVKDADGADITEQTRADWPDGTEAFDTKFAGVELELQRKLIEGPSPDEEPKLRELGWDPIAATATAAQRAQQEIDQVARFDANPDLRRDRVRDAVALREIMIELEGILRRGLEERGAELTSAFQTAEASRRSLDSMPSNDVAVTLKASYHRDGQHVWTPNDIRDIDALASTIPYCDIVVTDKAAAHHANHTGLADRLGTVVLSKLSDLTPHLA
jgi:hypothetical protein